MHKYLKGFVWLDDSPFWGWLIMMAGGYFAAIVMGLSGGFTWWAAPWFFLAVAGIVMFIINSNREEARLRAASESS